MRAKDILRIKMAVSAGVIDKISGAIIAIDLDGKERVLALGDEIFTGEIIKTSAPTAATISLNTGFEAVIDSQTPVLIDLSVATKTSFGNDAVVDVLALQQAILQSEIFENTAANLALTIQAPLSAYINNDPANGLLPEFSSNLPEGYAKFSQDDKTLFFRYEKGEFSLQDGWYISQNGLIIIGSNDAGELKIGQNFGNANIFIGDNASSISIDGAQINAIFGAENENNISLTNGASINFLQLNGDSRIFLDNGSQIMQGLNLAHDNKITLQNGSSIRGDIDISGDGAQQIDILSGSNLKLEDFNADSEPKVGNIYAANGSSIIKISGENSITGTIFCGDGKNDILIENGAQIIGNPAASEVIEGYAATAIMGGEGENSVVVSNATIFGNIELGAGFIAVQNDSNLFGNILAGSENLASNVKIYSSIIDGYIDVIGDVSATSSAINGDVSASENFNADGSQISGSIRIKEAGGDIQNDADASMHTVHSSDSDSVVDTASLNDIDLSGLSSGELKFDSIDILNASNAKLNINPKDVLDLGTRDNTLTIIGASEDKIVLDADDGWSEDAANSDASHKAYKASVIDDSGVTQSVIIKIENEIVQTDI